MMQLTVTVKRFTVTSGCNAYYLFDEVTERTACMGDGVDQDFRSWDTLGDLLNHDYEGRLPMDESIGTEAFRQAWEDDANDNIRDYFDAYFNDLYDLLVFDGGDKFADRYTIVLEPAPEDSRYHRGDLHHSISVSETDPGHPTYGVSMYGLCDPEYMAETQEQISFLDLPLVVQRHVAKRLED